MATATKKPRKKIPKTKSTPLPKRTPVVTPGVLARILHHRHFAWLYAGFALATLCSTTLYWSLISARVHASNADQLVNSYLFENSGTFKEAFLPGQHSFLIKWPLFFIIKLYNFSTSTYVGMTVGVVLITVILLAWLLYRLDRRPVVFGTVCLALASVLLLIPAQPYPGGLLPVNMAMLATRNIEYMVYIGSLILIIKGKSFKKWQFWAASVCLGLLIASDKLFLALSLGTAVMSGAVFLILRRKDLFVLAVRWCGATITAILIASVTLMIVSQSHLTHIINQSGASPYAISLSPHGFVLAIIYALTGFLTNLGANPASNVTILKQIPSQAFHTLLDIHSIAYVLNFAFLLIALLSIFKIIQRTFMPKKSPSIPQPTQLSLMLIATTIVAIGSFVFTNHYYAGDARYLTIGLFAVFISVAAWARERQWHREQLVIIGVVLCIGIISALPLPSHSAHASKKAMANIATRDTFITQALNHHPVDVLVGDYWRVIPTKQTSQEPLTVLPLESCTTPRKVLTSHEWQKDLNNHSFAYLLTFDKNLTDFPQCNFNQIVSAYGRPNTSALVAGSLDKPKEILLFYDKGSKKSAPPLLIEKSASILPTAFEKLPPITCDGPTILNIVAHEDDDLLFMNPDLQHNITAKNCVRTVYITAGDAGHGQLYWLGREQGSEAAYSSMLGTDTIWAQRNVKMGDRQYITIANPEGDAKTSLIFVRFPDGNIHGQGFGASEEESLAKLENGLIPFLKTVDNQSTYTSDNLVTTLVQLMDRYQPSEIRTQANFISNRYPDHSDHMAVGRFVKQAFERYAHRDNTPLKFYVGYPVHDWPQNVTDEDLAKKNAAFFAYARHDGGTCTDMESCQQTVYSDYLVRQYQNSY